MPAQVSAELRVSNERGADDPRTVFGKQLRELAEHARYDRSDFIAQAFLLVSEHTQQFGTQADIREYIREDLAAALADIGLPVFTDHSLVDTTGELTRRENERIREFKTYLRYLFEDSADRQIVGERAIQKALYTHHTLCERDWGAACKEFSGLLQKIVGFKLEMGASVTADKTELCEGLRAVLPSGVGPEGLDGWLIHHFPEAFPNPAESSAVAAKDAAVRYLTHARDVWWGSSHERIADALQIIGWRKVPVSDELQTLGGEILTQICFSRDDMPERLITALNLTPDEVRRRAVVGIKKNLEQTTFADPTYTYISTVTIFRETLARFGVDPQELRETALAKLPSVLTRQDRRMLESYLETFDLSHEILGADELKELTRDLLAHALQEISDDTRKWVDRLGRTPLGPLLDECRIAAANSFLAEQSAEKAQSFISTIGLPSGTDMPTALRPGAEKYCCRMLAEARLKEAQQMAAAMKLDLKAPLFRQAAERGIATLFELHHQGQWNMDRYNEIVAACGLPACLNSPDLRRAASPILELHLRGNTADHLAHAAWLVRTFAFDKEEIPPPIVAAASQGVETAFRTGAGAALRFLKNSCKVPDDVFIAGIRRWYGESEECRQTVLELLRFMPPGALNALNREFAFADYQRDLGVAGPVTYDQYTAIRREGNAVRLAAFVRTVKDELSSLVSGAPQDQDALHQNPRYRELVLTVYPNNWGRDCTFESVESCADRSGDLARFKIRPVYKMSLTEGATMRIRDGETLDLAVPERAEGLFEAVNSKVAHTGYREAAMRRLLLALSEQLAPDSTPDQISPATAVCLAALEASSDAHRHGGARELLMAHRLVAFEDARAYMAGTRARAMESKNREYVYLVELDTLYTEHLHDSIRSLVQATFEAPGSNERLAEAVHAHRVVQARRHHEGIVNRARIDKLGMSESFVTQVARSISGKGVPRIQSPEAREIITACESRLLMKWDGDPGELPEAERRALPLVRMQRERTFGVLDELGIAVSSGTTLAEINIAQVAQFDPAQVRSLPPGELEAYVIHRLLGLFDDTVAGIEKEIRKFVAETPRGSTAAKTELNGYITKNHTSAHARATGGVCVSMDNPDAALARSGGSSNACIWNMPEYLQLVMQDARSSVCQGLALLHIREGEGRTKILTVSPNPTSTLLYSVDERQLFEVMMKQIIQFAMDNKIDEIGFSSKRHVRTNRTGGEFEQAINDWIRREFRRHTFSPPQTFSYSPRYQEESVHIVWRRPSPWERFTGFLRNTFGR